MISLDDVRDRVIEAAGEPGGVKFEWKRHGVCCATFSSRREDLYGFAALSIMCDGDNMDEAVDALCRDLAEIRARWERNKG